jgi:hypothetical protein
MVTEIEMFESTNTKALGMIIKKDKLLAVNTGFLKMIVGVLKTCHTRYI